jgi:hypothetical protein
VKAEKESMIAGVLFGLLADVVFESAASLRRAFGMDMDRYFERRGFTPPSRRSAATR